MFEKPSPDRRPLKLSARTSAPVQMPSHLRHLTDAPAVERLAHWINEREAIRARRERGDGFPWTDDPILHDYRFCNVHREDDKETRWLKENWREPHGRDAHLWHAMLVARSVNWHPTLEECGYPEPWKKRGSRFGEAMRARKARGEKVFTGVYNISNEARSEDKITVVQQRFDRAWISAEPVRKGDTLAVAHAKLASTFGIGSFMAAQVVADLKCTPLLKDAPDWWTWASPGNGSMKGLNRVLGFPLARKWRPDAFVRAVTELRAKMGRVAPITRGLCLQDMQNCLCEFQKWDRTLHGQGKPRARFVPPAPPG